MSATQMESGARPCIECNGSGGEERTVCPHDCYGSRTPEGCFHAVSRWEKCSRCEGSKVEACELCGEPATLRYLREDLCDACAPAEEMRFDRCSLCDGKIDVRESRLPLCPYCQSVAQAHGELEANARRYPDPEQRGAA